MSAGSGDPDTIFAIASGYGRSAVAIVRLSGAGTGDAVMSLTSGALPEPRRLSLRWLRDLSSGLVLDQAMVAWMPGPGTYTGEDQAELHVHGGAAVKAAILRVLSERAGCRPAEPGEFTRRAFLNGRLDLTAVEGLADLIDAETEAQRRQALRQLEGSVSGQVEAWRERLVHALALCEAGLDFTDEEDVPGDVADGAGQLVEAIKGEVERALAGADRGERLRDGFVVVIAGPPNAGKSTLLNAIARREVAIVSPFPGTTRDAIEVRCDLAGLPVTFVDTAGLRESRHAVEREGMARTTKHMASADLVLWLTPVGEPVLPPDHVDAATCRHVWTKGDLGDEAALPRGETAVSSVTGAGLAELLGLIQDEAVSRLGTGDHALVTRERHRIVLSDLVRCLDRALVARQGHYAELVAEDLRLALRALGRMTGRVDVEDVLDRIFSAFCIGK